MKRSGLKTILYVLMSAIVAFPSVASAANYYVAKNGYDGNPGTEAQPWLTITKAANTAVAGDTVYVKQGTYKERVVIKNSGSAGKYITFAAYPGHTVTVDGSGLYMSFWQALFDMNGKSYIKISGFQITNSPQAGIHADNAHHIIIEKNSITNIELSPIKVGWGYSNNIIIDGNYVDRPYRSVWDSGSYTGPSTNKGWEEGISISNADTVEIKNNNVARNGKGECIVMKDGTKHVKVYRNTVQYCSAVGIYIGGWIADQSDFDIYSNIAGNSKQGIMIASEKGAIVQGVRIYNNKVYNNENGIDISSYSAGPSYPPNMRDISIINNVAYNNGYGKYSSGNGIIIEKDRGNNMRVSNVVIRNNIASNNRNAQITIGSGAPYVTSLVVDHNLVYGTKGYSENDGAYSITADPQFVNPGSSDFHLKSTSPGIDKGSSAGAPSFDYDENPRPKGNEYDIGAFEYLSSVTVPITVPDNPTLPAPEPPSSPMPPDTQSPLPDSIGGALDNINIVWATGGDAQWFSESATYYAGGSAMQSGRIPSDDNSWIKGKATGPGVLKFYWKVSSKPYEDYLKFYIDGMRKSRISGEAGWTQETYNIPAGTHIFKWAYSKDSESPEGNDAAWLDKVEFGKTA